MNYIVNQLPKHLFWDSDLTKLDDVEHYEKIIVWAFEFGDIDDMATVLAAYGRGLCKDVLTHAYYLHKSAILFASAFLNISRNEFAASHNSQHHAI